LFLPHLGVSGGLGVHCRGLLAALLRVSPNDTFTVFAPERPLDLFPLAGLDDTWQPLVADPRVTLTPLPWPAGASLADPLDPVLAGPVAAARPDVLLCSYYTGMANPPCPQAVVFHDAGFLEFPHVFGETARRRRAAVEAARPAIHTLVCVSGDARDRICRLLPFDPARTAVVWHALSDPPEAFAEAGDRTRFNGPLWDGGDTLADWGRYVFLPVGAATGFNRVRKNVPTGVSAFRRLGDPGLKLVIASTGKLHDKLLGELLPADELAGGGVDRGAWRSRDGRVIILPNLDRGPFLAAMSRAVAVLYPTRYEGFGLPAIEAMALGVPLVAGNATSLPEVVADAGVLVEPDDVEGFTAALRRVRDDAGFVSELVQKGKERAGQFTPERMGAEMRNVFAGMVS
jgi:glycosyltransferase involved in cell wall biosynthesis